jgi:alpha-glucosidase
MYPKSVRNLQQTINSYVLTFVPGGDGETTIYEDDGKSKEYSTAYATTKVTKRSEGNKVVITIAPRKGEFEGATATTSYELRLPANYPPKSVRVDGKEFKYARYAEAGEWGYDGYTLAPYIVVGEIDNKKGCVVEVEFAEGDLAQQDKLYGMQGIVNRCVALTAEFKMAYGEHYDSMAMLPDFYMNISQAPNFIMEFPQNIHKCVEEYYKSHAVCLSEIVKMDKFPVEFRQRVTSWLTKQ